MHAVSFYTFVGVCIVFVAALLFLFFYCQKIIRTVHEDAQKELQKYEEQMKSHYEYWTGQINTRITQLSLTEAKRLIDANRNYPPRPDNAGPAKIHRAQVGLNPSRQAWRFGGDLHK